MVGGLVGSPIARGLFHRAIAEEKDRAMAEMISSYWVNFASTGNPNGGKQSPWPLFKSRDMPPHILGEIADYPTPDVLNAYDERPS
jgi:carboxylesterase type B